MGTNYYARTNECDKCGRYDEVHIGKSSAGWEFTFQYNGARYYSDVPTMKVWLADKTIKNEYGEIVPHDVFWKQVEAKRGGQQKNTDLST
jgi:hypothetical protein